MPYIHPATYDLPFQSHSDTSEAAARKAARFVCQQGRAVLDWIRSRGVYGATQPEACAALGIGRPSACGRFRALEQRREIEKTAMRRDACAVYRALCVALLVLLASSAEAQQIEWIVPVASIITLDDPATASWTIWVDDGEWVPITSVTPGPVIPDVGYALFYLGMMTGTVAEKLAQPGEHHVLLRGTARDRESPLTGLPFTVIAPLRVTGVTTPVPPTSCPYTPPGGVAGTRALGYVIRGDVPVAKAPVRLAELRRDGWWIFPESATSTAVRISAVCLGELP